MEYEVQEAYEKISPGTMGVAQKISSDYNSAEILESGEETSKLVFLVKNEVRVCEHNQY